MDKPADKASWVLAAMAFLVLVAWTNLTGLGLGDVPLLYDDVALLRLTIALIGTAFAWVVIARRLAHGQTLAWDATWLVLAALAVWAVVSGALAGTTLVWLGHSERLEGVVTVALYAVLFGAGLQVGRSSLARRRIADALVLGATVLAVHGLCQVAKVDPTDYSIAGATYFLGSAFASLYNPNFLAGALVLALPVAVVRALGTQRTPMRIGFWVSLALIAAALYATYSQGAWLAAVVQGALAIGLRARARRRGAVGMTPGQVGGVPWHALALSLAVISVGVAVIVAVSAVAEAQGLRLWGSGLPETLESRTWLVESTAGMVGDHPIAGVGPDNYLEGFRSHRPDGYAALYGEASTGNNAHMWLLQYAATLGIPGGVLLTAALSLGLFRARPRSGGARETSDLVEAGIWIACVGFVVQMLFNVAVLASTAPFFLLLGLASAPRARQVAVPRRSATTVLALCGLIFAATLPASGMLLTADASFMASRVAYHRADTARAVTLAGRAMMLNPLSVKYARAVAQSRAVLVYEALDEGAPEARVRELHASASHAFDEVMGMSSDDYPAHAWRAALDAATSVALDDPEMRASAQERAEAAAALDRHHEEVVGLLGGDFSAYAILAARAAPALP